MTFAGDGRCLFRFGEQLRPGDAHIEWVAIGGHEIFERRY